MLKRQIGRYYYLVLPGNAKSREVRVWLVWFGVVFIVVSSLFLKGAQGVDDDFANRGALLLEWNRAGTDSSVGMEHQDLGVLHCIWKTTFLSLEFCSLEAMLWFSVG